MLTELVRSNPTSAAILGDVIVENLDLPGGDKVVKRLQAMLPEQIRQAETGQDSQAAAAVQQVQQLNQALQQLGARLQAAEADKGRDERKIDIDAYKAVTDRLASVSAMMTPDMVRAMVIETLQDVEQTAGRVPAGMAPGPMGPAMPQ